MRLKRRGISDVLIFFATVAGQLADPINFLCCLLAGLLLRRLHYALLVAVLATAVLHILVVIPVARAEHSDNSVYFLFTTVFGALVGTSLVFGIKKLIGRLRERKHTVAKGDEP